MPNMTSFTHALQLSKTHVRGSSLYMLIHKVKGRRDFQLEPSAKRVARKTMPLDHMHGQTRDSWVLTLALM